MKISWKELFKRILLILIICAAACLGVFLLRGAETLFDGYRQGLTDVYMNK